MPTLAPAIVQEAFGRVSAWPIALLGIPFDPLTIGGAVDRIESMIARGTPHSIVTANVDFLVKARSDQELRRAMLKADLVLCDGTPLVWASRWLGNSLPGRVAGADLVPALLQRAEQQGWRIFLLGAAPGVAEEAARRIALSHPNLPKVAHACPPFHPFDQMDNEAIVGLIRAARPDILLVAFGCPKQEKWISRNLRSTGVPVAIGVGATIDFLAGRISRAPVWMRRSGLEWLYRLAQEPRRLSRRYLDDLLHFLPGVLAQHRCMRPCVPAQSGHRPWSYVTPRWTKIYAGNQLQAASLSHQADFWGRVMEEKNNCLLNLAAVQTIDSTGVAFLVCWQKRLLSGGHELVLFRPSPAVRRALDRSKLSDHFIIADRHRDAWARLSTLSVAKEKAA